MGTVLKGGVLVEFEPPMVEAADLRISGGRIVARGTVEAKPDDDVLDASGKLVMPGLVSAHHHLLATLLRGAPRAGRGYEVEHALRLKLEQAAKPDDVEAAATAGALEGLLAGTTTVFDVHGGPFSPGGALGRVADGVTEVGLRAVIAWEVAGRDGAAQQEIFEDIASLASRSKARLRGAVALGSLDAVSDEALAAVRELQESRHLPLLVSIAEDRHEEARSVERYGKAPIDRLLDAGLVTDHSVLAQGVHLSWPDLSRLLATGTWMAHASRSNMASQAGLATAAKFGVRACLGTDVMPLDLLAEAQAASLRASDSGQPIDVLRFFANGHRLASQVFGATFGPLREGAVADLIVLDYHAPTPFNARTLSAHLQQGISSRDIESVMIDGVWRLWKRRTLALNAAGVARACRDAAQGVWSRMA